MDISLTERIRQGDQRAFDELYEKYYVLLCSLAMRIVGNKFLAEEVVDDVFFSCWDHRATLDIRNMDAYLATAVKNRSLNELQLAANRNAGRMVRSSDVAMVDFIDSLFREEEHPLDKLLAKELEACMMKAVDDLPADCRQVFRMSRFEHLKYAEISVKLGVSVDTVKYRMKQALRLLAAEATRYLVCMLMSIASLD